MGSLERLDDREADFVDGVGEVVDLVGVVVIGDNCECTGGDTEGGVHKGLGDTGREGGRVRCTGSGKSLERLDHTDHSTEQSDEGTESGEGSHDGEVLLESGHLECGSLFNFFLKGSYFLLFGENGVLVHFLIAYEGCGNNGCNAAFLLAAESLSTLDVVLLEAFLNAG